jgi:hypothetical protein
MSATAVATPDLPAHYADLIEEGLRERLVARIIKDHDLAEEEAREIVDATAGFLKLCADHPGQSFAPSKAVDIGWHTFLLYTRGYAAFCERIAGHFIHHEPNDVSGMMATVVAIRPTMTSRDTVAFMQVYGIPFNPTMWGAAEDSHCSLPHCESKS